MTLNNILNKITYNSGTTYSFIVSNERGFHIRANKRRITFTDELYYSLEYTPLAEEVMDYVVKYNVKEHSLVPAIAEYVQLPWYKKLFTQRP